MSGYPGARAAQRRRTRVAPLLPPREHEDENDHYDVVEPLLSSSSFENRHVDERGIGSSRFAPQSSNRLQAMNISQSNSSRRRKTGGAADELMWENEQEESSPLLKSQSPPSSLYTSPLSLDPPAVRKAKGHLAKVHRHHQMPSSRHYARPTTNRSNGVVRNRNPAPDSAWWLCSRGCCCCQCIRTNQVGVVEHFGRFQELVGPGRQCIPWPCTRIAARVSMRLQQLDVALETKTLDHVFVHLHVVVLFRVSNVYKAHYTLTHAPQQVRAHVLDEVRSTVPRMTVSEVFEQTSDIALSLARRLQGSMSTYGYEIVDALVKKVSPNPLIMSSMNEINASKRIKDSMPYNAEAFRVKRIKDAEAASERSYLGGVGVANQRKAIVAGMKETLKGGSEDQFSSKDVMDILLLSHYMDMLVAVGGGDSSSLIVQHHAGKVADLENQLSTYFTNSSDSAKMVGEKSATTTTTPAQVVAPVEVPDLLW